MFSRVKMFLAVKALNHTCSVKDGFAGN